MALIFWLSIASRGLRLRRLSACCCGSGRTAAARRRPGADRKPADGAAGRLDRHRGPQRRRRGSAARHRQPAERSTTRRRDVRSSSSPTAPRTTRSTCSAPLSAVRRARRGAARRQGAGAERRRRARRSSTSSSSPTRGRVFAPDALRELVAPFADPAVGGVTRRAAARLRIGALREPARGGNRRRRRRARDGIRTPSERRSPARDRVDDRRRRRPVLAVRKAAAAARERASDRRSAPPARSTRSGARLWSPLPADTILDDVLTPMRVVHGGVPRRVQRSRAGVRPRAPPTPTRSRGARCGRSPATIQILGSSRGSWLPWRNPVWFQYVSHKIGRLLVPYALLAAFFSSLVLAQHSVVLPTHGLPARWHSSRSPATARCSDRRAVREAPARTTELGASPARRAGA